MTPRINDLRMTCHFSHVHGPDFSSLQSIVILNTVKDLCLMPGEKTMDA